MTLVYFRRKFCLTLMTVCPILNESYHHRTILFLTTSNSTKLDQWYLTWSFIWDDLCLFLKVVREEAPGESYRLISHNKPLSYNMVLEKFLQINEIFRKSFNDPYMSEIFNFSSVDTFFRNRITHGEIRRQNFLKTFIYQSIYDM